MNKKKVLVLGTVQGEVPLVEAYKEMGYYVIVVGQNEAYPCCKIADESINADIMDRELMLKIARENEVAAVSSNVVERAIRTVAWVAERLNLEGIGYKTAEIFTNKYYMRKAAERIGIAVPRYAEVASVEEARAFAGEIGVPFIIKPEDNGGSKGVVKIQCVEELEEVFENTLNLSVEDKRVIMEEFIEGEEFIVDAFTHNYICENTDLSWKEKFEMKRNFISKAVVIQDADSCESAVEQKLLEANKRLVEGIGLKFGITHGEYIYNREQDKVYLVEITARGGGVYLASHLTPLATGVNVNRLLAEYSVGNDPLRENGLVLGKGAAAWYAFSLPKGQIVSVEGLEEARSLEGVNAIIDDKFFVGKKTTEMVDDSGKFGPILIYADTRDACYRIFDKVKQILKIKVKTPDGEKGIIW